ncbi:MAG: hypothetical protein ABI443_07285 [Chthoniobacterales bacterium]
MHKILLGLGTIAFLLVSACQTAPKIAFTPQTLQHGRLLWKTSSKSLVADIIIQKSANGDTRLILTKETGSPILIITRTTSLLDVDERMNGKHWRGEPSRLPSALIGWSALIDAIAVSKHMPEGFNEVHDASGWNAIYRIQNGKLETLDVFSEESNERYRIAVSSPVSATAGMR